MSSLSPTVPRHPLSHHLWSLAALAASATIALAAEHLAAGAMAGTRAPLPEAVALIGTLALPVVDSARAAPESRLASDPFEGIRPAATYPSVAPRAGNPTVRMPAARQLTAILMADDRTVAIIDERLVAVGDVLPGGARVARIQQDRVSIVEADGKWTVLTLARPRNGPGGGADDGLD